MVPDRNWNTVKRHLTDALIELKGWTLSREQSQELVAFMHNVYSQISEVPRSEHVCGLQGYNGEIDPPCPGCK